MNYREIKRLHSRLAKTFLILVLFFFVIMFHSHQTSHKNLKYEDFISRVKGPLSPSNSMLIKYLRANYLSPPSTLSYNLETNKDYIEAMNNSSMKSINYLLKVLFYNKTNGYFVEAGALDGQFLSNTLYLEQESHWTGILIEPDPVSYKNLFNKHRKSWLSNTCISTTSYPKQIILKSLEKSEILTSKDLIVDANFMIYKANSHDSKMKTNMDRFSIVSHHTVQCFPLETYLLALNVAHVDLLVLDTQGGEDDILYSFPWTSFTITTIIVEHYLSVRSTFDKKFVRFMNKHDYVLVAIVGEPDYIFVKKDSSALEAFKSRFEVLQYRLEASGVFQDNKTYNVLDMRDLRGKFEKVVAVTYRVQ